jgi:histidinol-phosphate aminotransferase
MSMTAIKTQCGLDRIAPYVPGKLVEEVQREYGLVDIIKLASNENPLGCSPKAVAAMQQALPGLNIYPDGQSYYLRQALARHLRIDPQWITIGNGADGLILETCMAFVEEGAEVIVSRSSFPIYDTFTHAMRGTLVKTDTVDFGLNLEAMARVVNERTRVIFVCNPNNPTGTMVRQAALEAFLRKVPPTVLVVLDEAYFHFAGPEMPDGLRYVQEGMENVVIFRTFSKAYGLAGIRLGYAVGQPAVLAPLNRVKEPFAVNLLAQVAGIAALEDDDFLQQTLQTNAQGREFLYGEFRRLGLFYVPSFTNFILVRLGPHAREAVDLLMRRGVIVRPCSGYELPEFLRITVGTRLQNQRLISTLEDIVPGLEKS